MRISSTKPFFSPGRKEDEDEEGAAAVAVAPASASALAAREPWRLWDTRGAHLKETAQRVWSSDAWSLAREGEGSFPASDILNGELGRKIS